MIYAADALVPLIILVIVLFGLCSETDVFSAFLEGAAQGLKISLKIFPTVLGMLTAVYMLRASGAVDMVAFALSPLLSLVGIPKECAALILLKPISGSGGLALGSEVMRLYGPDSYAGRVAAVMLGSSETSIYTISLYSGSVGLSDTRYVVTAALIGDAAAFIGSALAVRLFFGTG